MKQALIALAFLSINVFSPVQAAVTGLELRYLTYKTLKTAGIVSPVDVANFFEASGAVSPKVMTLFWMNLRERDDVKNYLLRILNTAGEQAVENQVEAAILASQKPGFAAALNRARVPKFQISEMKLALQEAPIVHSQTAEMFEAILALIIDRKISSPRQLMDALEAAHPYDSAEMQVFKVRMPYDATLFEVVLELAATAKIEVSQKVLVSAFHSLAKLPYLPTLPPTLSIARSLDFAKRYGARLTDSEFGLLRDELVALLLERRMMSSFKIMEAVEATGKVSPALLKRLRLELDPISGMDTFLFNLLAFAKQEGHLREILNSFDVIASHSTLIPATGVAEGAPQPFNFPMSGFDFSGSERASFVLAVQNYFIDRKLSYGFDILAALDSSGVFSPVEMRDYSGKLSMHDSASGAITRILDRAKRFNQISKIGEALQILSEDQDPFTAIDCQVIHGSKH